LALELADLAAEIALPAFESRDFSATTKTDGSPVTEVDLEVERALRRRLAEARPGHAVTGEELGDAGRSQWRWYLDPIDGTRRFIDSDPLWMTLIALAHEDQITVGVVAFPALGDRWWASRGHGAFHDARPLVVSQTDRLAEATVADDWHHTLARGVTDHPLAVVAACCGHVRPHVGHSFLAVAAGHADVAIGQGGLAWDYAAPRIIVEEAGGHFSAFDASPRIDARQAVVINGELHQDVIAVLKAARDVV
jgi:histidinol-phosphatase